MTQSIKGERDLRKLIPRSRIYWDANPSDTTASNGWDILGTSLEQFAVYRTYVDIVGWSKDDITAFTQGAAFQEGGPIYFTGGGAQPMKCWDMVTVNYIEDSAFTNTNTFLAGVNWCPPGLAHSNYNLEEILVGRWREFASDQNINTTRQVGSGVWGAGDATAGDRIYITKAFLLGTALSTDGQLVIPDSSVVIPTLLVKESDLVYLERLRRSYVLAGSRT